MIILIRIITVSVFMTLVACTPMLQQLKLPPERSYHRGYSLIPPNEKGWSIVQRDHNWLILAREGDKLNETYAIQTEIWALPPQTPQSCFINIVKEKINNGIDPTRFKLIKHDIAPYRGKMTNCVRFYMITEDKAAVVNAGEVAHMILEVIGLSCRHPANTITVIDVIYSHRHYFDQEDPALQEKADEVFKSLKFTNLR